MRSPAGSNLKGCSSKFLLLNKTYLR